MSESPPIPEESRHDSPESALAAPLGEAAEATAPVPGRSFLSLLYNHNPFYVISAVLMLYAVRAAYGELHIGAIDCWLMMGVLAGYTALLAGIGVAIVRWGTVWEDARSIFVLVLLLFLGVSVSADDLFVRMESPRGAVVLLVCGYLFSALVTELVFYGARLRLPGLYRVPLHLLLVLFYLAPWCCASLVEANRLVELQWRILLFPVAAALILLMLVPATRRGPEYVAENGGPWRWPLYPWTAFGAVTLAVALRTFALAMTFGPSGPIWIPVPVSSSVKRGLAINFDTLWGTYFLVPLVMAVAVLFVEAGLATRNARQIRRVLWCAPVILLLALPWSSGAVHWGFLRQVTETVGSPLFVTLVLLTTFYGYVWLRGVKESRVFGLISLLLFTFVGPQTIRPQEIGEPNMWPLLTVAGLMLWDGVRCRSSRMSFGAALLMGFAMWRLLPDTLLADYRSLTTYHWLWVSTIVLGLAFRDEFAAVLRAVGALQMPLAALLITIGPWSHGVPEAVGGVYVAGLLVTSLVIAWVWRSRWYLGAFMSLVTIGLYAVALLGFRTTSSLLGRPATMALGWSIAALLTAFLISAHKAGWLPRRLLPGGTLYDARLSAEE